MKKNTITMLAAVLTLSSCCNEPQYPTTFAHRGCWIDGYIPENSLDGIHMAARYGYPTLECDVKFTSDSVLVLMHDGTVNRTMRNASDYSEIQEKVKVKETPFIELRDNYMLASDSIACRKPIPTFAEFMNECEANGILPILHCDIYEGYLAAEERLGSKWIAFTEDYELCRKVRDLDTNVLILYSPKKELYGLGASELIERLDAIGGRCGISSMHYPLMRKSVCDSLRAAGYVTQSSIFPVPHEMDAISNGADIILSDFCWFPTEGMTPARTYRARNRKSISQSFDGVHLSCMTVRVSCKGAYKLTVNGMEKSYAIDNDGAEIRLGYRMYDTTPSVELVPENADGKAKVNYLKVDIYDF